jgi:DNA-binding MarR family transcriptional regulator
MLMDGKQAATPAETIAMADKIRFLCSVITKIARADLQTRLDNHDSGISAIEHGVLRHLSCGVVSMAEISRLMGVAPSTLVYVVDGLVKKKLVKRGKDPNDRRREPLSLEKKGAALFGQIPKMDASSVLVKRLEGMKESRRHEFLALLDEFAQGLPCSENFYLRPEPETRGEPTVSGVKQVTSAVKARKP